MDDEELYEFLVSIHSQAMDIADDCGRVLRELEEKVRAGRNTDTNGPQSRSGGG